MKDRAVKRSNLSNLFLIVGLVVAGAGCGVSEDIELANNQKGEGLSAAEICDGTDMIRFVMQMRPQGGVEGYDWMLTENGSWYAVIDGNCRFWAFPGLLGEDGKWSSIYTGYLDEHEVEQFAQDLELVDLPDEIYEDRSISHPPIYTIAFLDRTLVCAGPCPDVSTKQVVENGKNWVRKLQDKGEPLVWRMRGIFISLDLRDSAPQTWPVPAELEAAASTPYQWQGYAGGPGEGGFWIEDEVAISAVQQLRVDHRSGVNSGTFGNGIPVKRADGEEMLFYSRDSSPLEDESGIVNFEIGTQPYYLGGSLE